MDRRLDEYLPVSAHCLACGEPYLVRPRSGACCGPDCYHAVTAMKRLLRRLGPASRDKASAAGIRVARAAWWDLAHGVLDARKAHRRRRP
jgi:hypothetical protein